MANEEDFYALCCALPSFKVKELKLNVCKVAFFHLLEEQPELWQGLSKKLTDAAVKNYTVMDISFGRHLKKALKRRIDAPFALLNLYTERNKRLARWVEYPESVTAEDWLEAVTLAAKAEKDVLMGNLVDRFSAEQPRLPPNAWSSAMKIAVDECLLKLIHKLLVVGGVIDGANAMIRKKSKHWDFSE